MKARPLHHEGLAEFKKKDFIMTNTKRIFLALMLAGAAALPISAGTFATANAATADDLNKDASQAVQLLSKTNPVAAPISKQARAVLVFPSVVKAGLIFGGSYGEGVLKRGATVIDYYNSVSGSWGLLAGAQSYSYVVFLMSDTAMDYIGRSQGWEIGVGPTVVLVNEGVAKNLSTSTLKDDAYAFIFDQEGLMAALTIEGTKISKIRR
jgi:lipid-binding SYLF domain-containing protein